MRTRKERVVRTGWCLFAGLLLITGLLPAAAAQDTASGASAVSAARQVPLPGDAGLIEQIDQATAGQARISYHAYTGQVRFIGTDLEHPIPQPAAHQAGATPEQAARQFLATYGPLFGLVDPQQELAVTRVQTLERGRASVRFQQVYQGVPVFGGELIVQMDADQNVLSASGEILPGLTLDPAPTLEAADAQQRAAAQVVKTYDLAPEQLVVGEPELWIYNPILLKPGPDLDLLVWRLEVQTRELLPVRELVLVEAHRGWVPLHFNQVDAALNRTIYDNNNVRSDVLPGIGPAVRTEGAPPTGNPDVDDAYDYAGDTYSFYWNMHARDSIDGAGMGLINTVRYCPTDLGIPCPYPNAFWSGQQMVYGAGYASADDVVGHELTHGVTDYESHLFYYMQSGALSEAFSDVWGEFVDLGNGAGNDGPGVRWLMGEDLPIGAIRSMSNPPAFGDPDRMTSPNYFCGEEDLGGVHTNSGVANKAAYLMVDGGSFNGYTVTGLGIDKTAKIWYQVQTNLLTSAGDYQDLYDGLQQACTNLIGTSGITSADCQEVKDAVDATQMHQQPPSCRAPEVPVCAVDRTDLWIDDLENHASGNWTHAAISGNDEWYYPQTANPYGFDATYATSGQYNFWGNDGVSISDFYIAMTQNVLIPNTAATPYFHFKHAYGFQDAAGTNYDAGVLEYSTNNGPWNDAGSLSMNNGYNGTVSNCCGNPLAGRSAFVAESNGYISTRVNLSSLKGQNVRFRFRIGIDPTGEDWGWFIDDVRFYTCLTTYNQSVYLPLVLRNWPPVPSVPVLNPISNPDGDGNYTVSWSAATLATGYALQEDDNASFTSPATVYSGPGTSTAISGRGPGTYYYRVNASNVYGSSGWSNVQSVTVGALGPTPGYWKEDGSHDCAGCSEFWVTADQAHVDDFAIYINVSGCGGYKITHTNPVAIVSNAFSFSGSYYASGTFTSSTRCAGQYGLSSFYIPGCGYVSGGPWSYVSLWQHARSEPAMGGQGRFTVEAVEEVPGLNFHPATVQPEP